MFELITQILILVAVYYLVRYVLLAVIDPKYLTWLGGIVLVLLLILAFLDPTNRTVGILWGILSFPLRPLGLALVLLAYALRAGIKKADGPQVLAAFLVLLIFSLPLTAYLLTAQTEQRNVIEAIRRQEAANPRPVQAIVVLNDGALPSDPAYRIRTQVTRIRDGISVTMQSRLLYAAELYAARSQCCEQRGPLVIVSIGPQPVASDGQRRLSGEAQTVIDLLVSRGVPESQIRLDPEGVDPRSSAVSVRRILLGPQADTANCRLFAVCEEGVNEIPTQQSPPTARVPIVLVSPAIMIRRAASTFSHLYFEVSPRPTDFYVFQLERGLQLAALSDLIPSAEALVITTRVVDEYLATVYYFLRGWLADPLTV